MRAKVPRDFSTEAKDVDRHFKLGVEVAIANIRWHTRRRPRGRHLIDEHHGECRGIRWRGRQLRICARVKINPRSEDGINIGTKTVGSCGELRWRLATKRAACTDRRVRVANLAGIRRVGDLCEIRSVGVLAGARCACARIPHRVARRPRLRVVARARRGALAIHPISRGIPPVRGGAVDGRGRERRVWRRRYRRSLTGARCACARIPGHRARRLRRGVVARVPRGALAIHPISCRIPSVRVGAVDGWRYLTSARCACARIPHRIARHPRLRVVARARRGALAIHPVGRRVPPVRVGAVGGAASTSASAAV